MVLAQASPPYWWSSSLLTMAKKKKKEVGDWYLPHPTRVHSSCRTLQLHLDQPHPLEHLIVPPWEPVRSFTVSATAVRALSTLATQARTGSLVRWCPQCGPHGDPDQAGTLLLHPPSPVDHLTHCLSWEGLPCTALSDIKTRTKNGNMYCVWIFIRPQTYFHVIKNIKAKNDVFG